MTNNLKKYSFSLATAIALTSQAFAVEVTKEFSISGFADGQFQYTKEVASPGFLVNDAALYLKYARSNVQVFIDLPFSGNNTTDADFNFATGKAQAFIWLQPADAIEFTVGQFDALYGFEAADSVDSTFTTNAGTASLIPTVHLGAMTGLSHGEFSLKALLANPSDLGRLDGRNPSFGVQIAYEHGETCYLKAGYLGHNQQGAAGMESLYDFMAGAQLGMLSTDVQFDIQKIGGGNTGYQLLGHFVADVTEEASLGLRGNWLKEADGTNYQVFQVTTGPQYAPKSMEGLTLKADYSWSGTEVTDGASRTSEHTVAAAAIYSF